MFSLIIIGFIRFCHANYLCQTNIFKHRKYDFKRGCLNFNHFASFARYNCSIQFFYRKIDERQNIPKRCFIKYEMKNDISRMIKRNFYVFVGFHPEESERLFSWILEDLLCFQVNSWGFEEGFQADQTLRIQKRALLLMSGLNWDVWLYSLKGWPSIKTSQNQVSYISAFSVNSLTNYPFCQTPFTISFQSLKQLPMPEILPFLKDPMYLYPFLKNKCPSPCLQSFSSTGPQYTSSFGQLIVQLPTIPALSHSPSIARPPQQLSFPYPENFYPKKYPSYSQFASLQIILPSTLTLFWYFPSNMFPLSYSIMTYPWSLLSFHSPFLILAPGITFSKRLSIQLVELLILDLCLAIIRSLSLEFITAFTFFSDFEYILQALFKSLSILVLLFLGPLTSLKGSDMESLKSNTVQLIFCIKKYNNSCLIQQYRIFYFSIRNLKKFSFSQQIYHFKATFLN